LSVQKSVLLNQFEESYRTRRYM